MGRQVAKASQTFEFVSLPSRERVSILVQAAVVVLGEKTDEGQLIQAVAPVWDEILKLLQRDFETFMQIPPRKWEEIIAASYEKVGFDEVTLTPAKCFRNEFLTSGLQPEVL